MTMRKPRDKAATIAANRETEFARERPIGCQQCSDLMQEVRDLRRSLELAHKALEVKESLNETLRREVDALRDRSVAEAIEETQRQNDALRAELARRGE